MTTIIKGGRSAPYAELQVVVEKAERKYGEFTQTFKIPQARVRVRARVRAKDRVRVRVRMRVRVRVGTGRCLVRNRLRRLRVQVWQGSGGSQGHPRGGLLRGP